MNVSSIHWPGLRLWLTALAVIRLAIVPISSSADEAVLFPCPDCGGQVSRRAVMCPKCGCPGTAIQEAVRLDDERKRPKRLATVSTDARKGLAVLVRQGDAQYLIMDLFLLAGTSSLTITELGTDNPIGYSEPELCADAPMLRFKIIGQPRGEFLSFSAMPAGAPPACFLTSADQRIVSTLGIDDAVAALDESGGLSAFHAGGGWVPVQGGMTWITVKPADLRAQVDLLARAKESARKGALAAKDSDELTKTAWLSKYLQEQTIQLLQPDKKTAAP